MQNGAVESCRLERVVAALGNQRSTDEGDPGETVKEPEFPHRVRKVDICLAGDRLTPASLGGAQAASGQHCFDGVATRRMTRCYDRQKAGMLICELAMNAGDDLLLSCMRAGREPSRTRPNLIAQVHQLRK